VGELGAQNVNLLKPGYLLHWYKIDTVLGQGGFGITYLAEDQNLQEKVAIKEYFPSQFASRSGDGSVQQLSESHSEDYQWGLERFISEARTLTQFRHHSIVRVRNVFEENNTAYIVMDFEEGVTLGDKLKGKKTLPEEQLLSLFLPLMEGLEVIHAAGFIHRDIKPDNIVVKEDRAILIDFGTARQAVGERSISMTQIVSAGYAPFEQYQTKGEHQGPWTDIYAMGAILYRAVTGIAPSQAIDRSKALLETSRDTYVSAGELCGNDYSGSLLHAIDHALAFSAKDRPQTVAGLREEIQGDARAIPESEARTGLVDDKGQWSQEERTQIKQRLQQVLASKPFAAADKLQQILTYLMEESLAGRGEQINQTSIAVDVLGRDARFDPSLDSLVRVEAGRLRTKLREYYYEEGKEDTVRFELPKGRYIPRITITQPGTGQIETTEPPVEPGVRQRQHLLPALAIGLITAILLVTVFVQHRLDVETVPVDVPVQRTVDKAETPAELPLRKSVAVLPFENRSDEKKDVHFTNGLHDDMLTQLTKIADLKVISRTSVMQYRDTTTPLPQIAEALQVDTILTGSVQRSGDRIRIHVQFINARTDEHLWAESYDRELTTANIFDVQREVATKAAGTLQSTITPEEQERIATLPTENLAAYEAYLLGKQSMATRRSDKLAEAVDYFQQAIELDPEFALAYAGLAETYLLHAFSEKPVDEMKALAEIAVNKALKLDDNSAEVYTMLALLGDDFEETEAAYKKALALNPNYTTALFRYGKLLRDVGRDEESWTLLQRALALDPLSIVINATIAGSYFESGRFDEALAQYDKVIEFDPTATLGYVAKADLYWSVYARLDKAVPLYRKAVLLDPTDPWHIAMLGILYLDLGDDKQAECWINRGIKLGKGFVPMFIMSMIHIYRNEFIQALSYAREALKDWPTDGETLAILRDHDLRTGNVDKARSHYEKAHPVLLVDDEPTINSGNYQAAIGLAYVMQLGGEKERAELLLDSSLTFIPGSGIQRLGITGYRLADIQIYALRGEKQLALSTLRQAIDEGWRFAWWYFMGREPTLESIRHEPEFQTMLAEIKSEMTEQLTRVKAMEKEGDVCVAP
jgi:serine/threonine protein kinase/TolB-like protein/Flp pilus assembly protein TadD